MNFPRTDNEIEVGLRDVFRHRHPGPAPIRLRQRVDSIPEGQTEGQPRMVRVLTGVAATAAAIALLFIGLRFRDVMPNAGVYPSPGVGNVPFDPTIVGPGINTTGLPIGPMITIVAVPCLALFASVLRGPRLIVTLAGAAVLLAYALAAALIPVGLHVNGWAPGLSLVQTPKPIGYGEDVYYVVAAPRTNYSFGLILTPEGPFPISVEGLSEPNSPTSWSGPLWTAVWLDGEANGGMAGPARPFESMVWPYQAQAIWLVGSAGTCAVGPSFDPSRTPASGFRTLTLSQESMQFNISIFGWPRQVALSGAEDLRLVEPEGVACPGH